MKNIYVEIRMEDMDINKDHYLTLSEYIGQSAALSNTVSTTCFSVLPEDVWPSKNRGGEEPEWLPREKRNFATR